MNPSRVILIIKLHATNTLPESYRVIEYTKRDNDFIDPIVLATESTMKAARASQKRFQQITIAVNSL